MSSLSKELYNNGYNKTEQESPFHDNGTLWKNSHEIVCDETGIVIRNPEEYTLKQNNSENKRVPRYENSENVILPGGMQHAYQWGDSNGTFVYDKKQYSS